MTSGITSFQFKSATHNDANISDYLDIEQLSKYQEQKLVEYSKNEEIETLKMTEIGFPVVDRVLVDLIK